CGSAGLAENVSSLLPSRSRLLVVSGSVNSVTLGQIASAERELDVTVLEPNLSGVLTSEEQFETAIKNLTDEAEEALVESKDVAVRLAKSRDLIIGFQEQGKKLGMNRLQVAERLLSVLSESFTKIAESHRFAGLILIGGDTAVRIMNAIGACGIRIEKEVLPGIPIGRILGGEHDGLRVITKAGGFGGSQSLVKIMKAMQESG
ncbi:MAG: hypothetical protein NWF14_05340, partial [Candidatus Bathyarchaeota archaeon]|nr:hypothetical protein [Candidatus Bathyarchaeota archaeon]